jgi:hypothetical protein
MSEVAMGMSTFIAIAEAAQIVRITTEAAQ